MIDMDSWLQLKGDVCEFRPNGVRSLVEVVDLVKRAISWCRERRIGKLIICCTDVSGVRVPTLVDRFLAVEQWADAAQGMVIVVLVVHPEYVHPKKFGIRVALDLGLVADVYTSEADALIWLNSGKPPDLVDYVASNYGAHKER